MAFALRCPECRKTFKWEPTKPDPRFCPLCDADMGEPPDADVISIPAFLSAKTKATDKVYRDHESASMVRVEKAAELAGVPVSEMASLKITDIKGGTHEGDIAAMPVVNAVTQQMDAINARGGQVGWQGTAGVEYSGAVQQGPFPNMGAKMRTAIHQANGSVSDRPGLETQQPGYRYRG
jgi:hypothetical protein